MYTMLCNLYYTIRPYYTLYTHILQSRDFVPDLVGADPLRPAAADRVTPECGRVETHGDHGMMLYTCIVYTCMMYSQYMYTKEHGIDYVVLFVYDDVCSTTVYMYQNSVVYCLYTISAYVHVCIGSVWAGAVYAARVRLP